MKLVVIGATSQSTPALADALRATRLLDDLEITLVARDPRRLDAVARAMMCLADSASLRIVTCDRNGDFSSAMRGADVVLLQARYGGLAGRSFDERFPLAHGIPGDEGLGPSGLSNAWRSWPHLDALLRRVAEVAPQALLLCMTSPLGILTRCALQRYPALRFAGICELPFVTLAEACRRAAIPWRKARFAYAGVNHLGWFDAIEAGGVDVLDAFVASLDDGRFPSPALVESVGAWPLKYVRLHYERSAVAAEQVLGACRARILEDLAEQAFEAFESGGAAEIRAALARRPAPWYEHAIAPILKVCGGEAVDTPLFLTTANAGYLRDFADEDVVEVPFAGDEAGLRRIERDRDLPARVADDLAAFVGYERLAARAVLERSPASVAESLAHHPWVRDSNSIAALTSSICGAEAAANLST